MKKINFAGGEPFLYPQFLGQLCIYCKTVLRVNVSIVSNGSKIRESWFQKYGAYVDILAISCDSFDEATNIKIGRGEGHSVKKLRQIAAWCSMYNVKFKMNSVICLYNYQENMAEQVCKIGPFRWKCFQVLVQPGENDSEKALRDARALVITAEQFEQFCAMHSHLEAFVPEPNDLMAASYLILDEYMCFLDKEKDTKSKSILDVGVGNALNQVHWDEKGFVQRGGIYEWSKEGLETVGCVTMGKAEYEW